MHILVSANALLVISIEVNQRMILNKFFIKNWLINIPIFYNE